MWIKWAEWRLDYQPHTIKKKHIKHTTFRKCLFNWKQNADGSPCIVISPGATRDTYTIDELEIVIAYALEKSCKLADR
jgi:hypothetical protein